MVVRWLQRIALFLGALLFLFPFYYMLIGSLQEKPDTSLAGAFPTGGYTLDNYTTINARIGHLAADEVLATIARVLRDVAGPRDLACRIGGGRFGVVLSQADSRDAEGLFERLQSALRDRPLPNLGVVSFSGGVAELLPNDDATALIVRADAALGLAKSSGRDMVVTAAKRPAREVA